MRWHSVTYHGVLGEFTGEDEPDRGLDFAGGHGGLLVVAGELGRFGGDLLEDVVDERVHDGHGLGGDAGVGVHLLEDLVDVDLVGLGLGLALAAFAAFGDGLLGGLLGGGGLGHCDRFRCIEKWPGATTRRLFMQLKNFPLRAYWPGLDQ